MTLNDTSRKASDSRPDAERLKTFDQHKPLLFSIAYRMLGSVADAEDMVQETFIGWLKSGDEEIRSPRAYLVTIISRLCINHLQSARLQREQYFGQWLPEPIVTEVGSDPLGLVRLDESLSMAFLVMLERLAPVERAVFLLREVFDYDYSEIARILQQSEANCRQILHRARQHVAELRPRFKVSTKKRNQFLQSFLRAVATGDMEGLIGILADDVVLSTDGGGKAAALPKLIHGPWNVARAIILGRSKFQPDGTVQSRIVSVNGAPGVVSYLNGIPRLVFTLDADEDCVRRIYFITNPDKLSHLAYLPELETMAKQPD